MCIKKVCDVYQEGVCIVYLVLQEDFQAEMQQRLSMVDCGERGKGEEFGHGMRQCIQ